MHPQSNCHWNLWDFLDFSLSIIRKPPSFWSEKRIKYFSRNEVWPLDPCFSFFLGREVLWALSLVGRGWSLWTRLPLFCSLLLSSRPLASDVAVLRLPRVEAAIAIGGYRCHRGSPMWEGRWLFLKLFAFFIFFKKPKQKRWEKIKKNSLFPLFSFSFIYTLSLSIFLVT